MQGARCRVRGAWYEVQGARYEAQDTRYVVLYVARGTLVGSIGRAYAKIEIMYITWEPVGSEPPCHKGSCIPLAPILQKNGMSSGILQIAHKFDKCALVGMPGMCTWYMVHAKRYEVRGMWYVVQGTEYLVRGTRYEVQNTLFDYPTKRTSPRNMSIRGGG